MNFLLLKRIVQFYNNFLLDAYMKIFFSKTIERIACSVEIYYKKNANNRL